MDNLEIREADGRSLDARDDFTFILYKYGMSFDREVYVQMLESRLRWTCSE